METLIRNLQNDDESLHSYLRCNEVSFDEVRRRLFLLERERNQSIPDHYYHLQMKKDLLGIENLAGTLSIGVAQMAKSYLTLNEKKVFVRKGKITQWQDLLPSVTPLLLTAGVISQEFQKISVDELFEGYILPNTKFTCIHSPDINDFHDIKFNDLHVHLNGMTETDIVWQDSLKHPNKVYRNLKSAAKNNVVHEQYEQEGRAISDYKFYQLLYIARQIRWMLFWLVYDENHESIKDRTTAQLLTQLLSNGNSFCPSGGHPFSKSLKKAYSVSNEMPFECLMYILVINKLNKYSSRNLASIFHFYLLILGLFNRLLVQQLHQYGFDQFQKNTLNQMREYSEILYEKRFLQAGGNQLSFLSLLEARFSPKSSEKELDKMIQKIKAGFIKAKNQYPSSFKLTLVGHFIKQKDTSPQDSIIRHKELRLSLLNKASVLEKYIPKLLSAYLRDEDNNIKIVGIDAASNELHTPPEVFAPVFRKLRWAGVVNRVTFHVGEDFYHIVSGIRAIYEAFDFLELKEGDRIGHGVAAGLCPIRWSQIIGSRMLISKGEWLDNLIFVRFILKEENQLDEEILKIGSEIYNTSFSLSEHEEAWLMRRYCPLYYFGISIPSIEPHEEEFCKKITHSENAIKIFKQYHSLEIRNRCDEIIEIEPIKLLNAEQINKIQYEILKKLASKKIIIEALPTSNVRIGHYEDIKEYHLWKWKEWSNKFSIPDIVIGSDDPGIFATNIYNEYAHLYQHLEENSPTDITFINELIENSKLYKFK